MWREFLLTLISLGLLSELGKVDGVFTVGHLSLEAIGRKRERSGGERRGNNDDRQRRPCGGVKQRKEKGFDSSDPSSEGAPGPGCVGVMHQDSRQAGVPREGGYASTQPAIRPSTPVA